MLPKSNMNNPLGYPTHKSNAKDWYRWYKKVEFLQGSGQARRLFVDNWVNAGSRVLEGKFNLAEKMLAEGIMLSKNNAIFVHRDKPEVRESWSDMFLRTFIAEAFQQSNAGDLNRKYEEEKRSIAHNIISNLNF